jgi:hypothetical protein
MRSMPIQAVHLPGLSGALMICGKYILIQKRIQARISRHFQR